MHLFDLEELDDLGNVVQSCVAAISNALGLLDCLLNAYKVALVFVLAQHTRFKLRHLVDELVLRLLQSFDQEMLLAHKNIGRLPQVFQPQIQNLTLTMLELGLRFEMVDLLLKFRLKVYVLLRKRVKLGLALF